MRFFLFLLIMYSMSLHAHVIQTDSFELLEESIPNLNQHDLVIFDYHKTLAQAHDALLQSCGKRCLQGRILQVAPHLTRQQVEELISLILLQRKPQLVDPYSVEIIQKLQNKGVKVIVLTAMRTGPYGHIPNTEQWRLNELGQFGLNFQGAFPQINRLDFKEFKRQPSPPVYLQGILCSGSVTKGEALNSFFKRTGFRPRRLIFVDNAADHHASIEKLTRRRRIPYLGYYYTKGLKERKSVDEQIANFQIQYLVNYGEWLDDEEAERRSSQWTNTPT